MDIKKKRLRPNMQRYTSAVVVVARRMWSFVCAVSKNHEPWKIRRAIKIFILITQLTYLQLHVMIHIKIVVIAGCPFTLLNAVDFVC
jgi:hypothetical protein